MKIFFFLFFLIPNLTLSLTFKDGKQVDEKSQSSNNFEKKSQPLAGYQIENEVNNIISKVKTNSHLLSHIALLTSKDNLL